MRIDGLTALAMVLIISFAIDRTVTGTLFLLSFLEPWKRAFPDPETLQDPVERLSAAKRHKLLYFCLAGLLGTVALAWYGNVRFLAALGFATSPVLDALVTGLILMGGSDRVSHLVNLPGLRGAEKAAPRPIEVTGRLVLEEPEGRKVADTGRS